MIPVLSVVGHHNAGKTTFMLRLIESFAERGVVVGAAKHAPHLEELDQPGSDSYRLREVGADRVLLLGQSAAMLMWSTAPDKVLSDEVDRLFAGCDLVLIEGLKSGPYPKIEVYGGSREDPLAGDLDVLAVVSDEKLVLPDGTRQFGTRAVEDVVDMLETIIFA